MNWMWTMVGDKGISYLSKSNLRISLLYLFFPPLGLRNLKSNEVFKKKCFAFISRPADRIICVLRFRSNTISTVFFLLLFKKIKFSDSSLRVFTPRSYICPSPVTPGSSAFLSQSNFVFFSHPPKNPPCTVCAAFFRSIFDQLCKYHIMKGIPTVLNCQQNLEKTLFCHSL